MKVIVLYAVGKRSCLGETIARQIIFLFLTSLVQRFDIRPPEGRNTISVKEHSAVVTAPATFKVRLILRVKPIYGQDWAGKGSLMLWNWFVMRNIIIYYVTYVAIIFIIWHRIMFDSQSPRRWENDRSQRSQSFKNIHNYYVFSCWLVFFLRNAALRVTVLSHLVLLDPCDILRASVSKSDNSMLVRVNN